MRLRELTVDVRTPRERDRCSRFRRASCAPDSCPDTHNPTRSAAGHGHRCTRGTYDACGGADGQQARLRCVWAHGVALPVARLEEADCHVQAVREGVEAARVPVPLVSAAAPTGKS